MLMILLDYIKYKSKVVLYNIIIVTHVCMLSLFSRVQFFSTLQTVARQVPPYMGFSRQ